MNASNTVDSHSYFTPSMLLTLHQVDCDLALKTAEVGWALQVLDFLRLNEVTAYCRLGTTYDLSHTAVPCSTSYLNYLPGYHMYTNSDKI